MFAMEALPITAPVPAKRSLNSEAKSWPPALIKRSLSNSSTSIAERIGQIAQKIISNQTAGAVLSHRVILLVNDQTKDINIEVIEASLDSTKAPTKVLDFKESLEVLQDKLSLSVTQLADIFGVTRKSIYDWMDGADPRLNSKNKAQLLTDIVNSSNIDLSKLKTVWNIPFSDVSFKSIIANEKLEYNEAKALAIKKIEEIYPRLESNPSTPTKSHFIGNSHTSDIERAT